MERKQKAIWTQIVLCVLVLASLVADFVTGQPGATKMYAVIALVLVLIFDPALRLITKTELTYPVLLADLIFIVEATYFGNKYDFYHRWVGYDIVLHLLSGVLIGLTLYEVFFPGKIRMNTGLLWRLMLLVIICIAAAGFWEIMEFFSDIITGGDSQRNLAYEWEFFGREGQNPAIRDSMNDMINGTVGGLASALIVFLRERKALHDKH